MAVTPIEDDRHFVDSLLAGDRQTWEKIIHRFSGMTWRILRGECRLSQDRAADAFQEIFLGLQKENFRRLRQWRGRAPLDAYMVVVVRRLARDFLRAQKPEGNEELPDPEDPNPTPEEAALLAERRVAVQACRERLAPRDRELLDLRYNLELQYRAVAARLKMTVSNVGVALSRAEDRVRRCLQKHYPDLFGGWGGGEQAIV